MKQSEFLEECSDPDNHRPLLWLALEATKNNMYPVVEYGAGTGSTPYLRKYCEDENIEFRSYDSNKEWASKWKSMYIENWLDPNLYWYCKVALVDQAPGEFRHESMKILANYAEIVVVHDAEPDESMGYRLSEIWHLYRYRVFVKGTKVWSAAVSNHYDLTKHVGERIGDFKIEL